MNEFDNIPLKKIFLQSLIVSVGFSAFLGILAILFGNFGEFEIRILLTTLTISAASLCGLCCGASIEIRGTKGLPVAGILLAGVAAVFVIAGIWIEPRSEFFWKLTATLSLFAVAFSHLSLLSLARLSDAFAWALPTAYGIVFAVAGLLSAMIWAEWSDEAVFRVLGVLAVLDGAITVLIPIFHRLSRDELPAENAPAVADIDREIEQLENRLRELKEMKRSAANEKAVESLRTDATV